ncbi:MAG: hypothetical protein J6T51_04885 [Kiritimatiellae bacterium]|nr:hypothetical protein [Kiritimatiellia bacterium]
MKKLLIIAAAAALGGCAQVGGPSTTTALGIGGIIDDNCSPASFRIDNNVKAAKCGEATSKSIVLYTSGDSSIKAAMDAGGITKIHHIDYRVFNVLNFYSKATTIVWGE